ncbi:hypothetical protein [Radiobacillus deserti]|uniref:Uncharacterized protein n=1 Tax=Radiobacillus deserti TaxID=2594883 RepID=A0A516KDE5_9BACI|nr:hypothetical protein [Radiobacillus deserti]QDP39434.1 hypothetical protein FN924_04135 [Radiobacillus deserti]
MTKTTTIQISVYDYNTMEELIYETQIGSIEELIALSYRYDKSVKYKKPTDKNWYYCRTMIKRLFKKELNSKNNEVKLVTTNDLNKVLEERFQAKLEKKREQEQRDLEQIILDYDCHRKNIDEVTLENIVF